MTSDYPDDDQYAIVTTISTHKIRYCIPMSELQKLNTDSPVDLSWAADSVTMQEVDEFSQDWLGEQIVDVEQYDQHSMLQLFDKDNQYLKDWTTSQKLKYIYDWKAKQNDSN